MADALTFTKIANNKFLNFLPKNVRNVIFIPIKVIHEGDRKVYNEA